MISIRRDREKRKRDEREREEKERMEKKRREEEAKQEKKRQEVYLRCCSQTCNISQKARRQLCEKEFIELVKEKISDYAVFLGFFYYG